MGRYTITRPKYMDAIEESRHNPRTIIACLIALAVYAIYNVATSVLGGLYLGIEVVNNPDLISGSFVEMLDNITNMLLSQTFLLIALFSTILIIVLVIILVRAIHKRKLKTIGMSSKNWLLQYIIGIGVGALILLVLLIPTIASEYDNIYAIGWSNIVIVFLFAFLIQSAAEEFLFRGYLFSTLTRRLGVVWAAVVSSGVFAMMHLLNPGMNLLVIIEIFLLGVFLCFYVVRTNNLWGACGIHFAWNFLQGTFADIDVSGIEVDYRIIGFRGVDFSPEGGGFFGNPAELITIAILLAAIAVILFVGKKRIAIKKPENDEFEF